jgi:hypothetical protein
MSSRDHDHAHTQPARAPAPITNGNAAPITNEAVAQQWPVGGKVTRSGGVVVDQQPALSPAQLSPEELELFLLVGHLWEPKPPGQGSEPTRDRGWLLGRHPPD